MKENELLDEIEKEIGARQPKDFRLDVVRRDVSKEGNWWYVVVKPDRPIDVSRYNAIVREVKGVLEDEKHEKVLLIPALVD